MKKLALILAVLFLFSTPALATSVDDLRAYAPALRQAMAENHLCVLGASSRVKQASALFDHLIKLEN